jgi:hypothetical protein
MSEMISDDFLMFLAEYNSIINEKEQIVDEDDISIIIATISRMSKSASCVRIVDSLNKRVTLRERVIQGCYVDVSNKYFTWIKDTMPMLDGLHRFVGSSIQIKRRMLWLKLLIMISSLDCRHNKLFCSVVFFSKENIDQLFGLHAVLKLFVKDFIWDNRLDFFLEKVEDDFFEYNGSSLWKLIESDGSEWSVTSKVEEELDIIVASPGFMNVGVTIDSYQDSNDIKGKDCEEKDEEENKDIMEKKEDDNCDKPDKEKTCEDIFFFEEEIHLSEQDISHQHVDNSFNIVKEGKEKGVICEDHDCCDLLKDTENFGEEQETNVDEGKHVFGEEDIRRVVDKLVAEGFECSDTINFHNNENKFPKFQSDQFNLSFFIGEGLVPLKRRRKCDVLIMMGNDSIFSYKEMLYMNSYFVGIGNSRMPFSLDIIMKMLPRSSRYFSEFKAHVWKELGLSRPRIDEMVKYVARIFFCTDLSWRKNLNKIERDNGFRLLKYDKSFGFLFLFG